MREPEPATKIDDGDYGRSAVWPHGCRLTIGGRGYAGEQVKQVRVKKIEG